MATSPYFSTSNQYIEYDIHVDEISTDITNNTSYIRVWVIAWRTNTGYTTYGSGTCYCTVNGTSYSQSIGPSQKIEYESDTVLFDKYLTIPHDSDGKKSIYVDAKISHDRFSSSYNGFTVTLTNIPRKATITNAPDFNDTSNPTITYSNPAGSAATTLQACISLDGTTANVPYRDISKTGTSYTFNLTSAERNTLLASTPNSSSKTVYFIVKTVLGGTTYTSSVAKTMTVINANPTITGATYLDTNATTTAITGNNHKIIQALSTVRFDFATLTALKSATLVKVEVTVNTVKQTLSLSGTTQSNKQIAFGTINATSDVTAQIVLTDSRGNTTTVSKTISMVEWALPTAVISLSRKSNYYDESYLKVTASISSLEGNNTVTIQYQYREKGGSYNALTTISNDTSYTLTLDNTKAYDFRVVVSDRIGTTTYNKTLPVGIPIIFFDRKNRSVGIGTIPDEVNELAVDRRINLKNLSHESVADLWSITGSTQRRALFRITNQDGVAVLYACSEDDAVGNGYINLNNVNGNILVRLSKSNGNGGYLSARNPSGSSRAELYENSGGHVWLAGNNGNANAKLDSGSNGGSLTIYDSSGNKRGEIYAAAQYGAILGLYNQSNQRVIYADAINGSGRLWLIDSSNNVNISLSGSDGLITCKKVKASEQVEELYSGSLSSGSTTFNYGNYNMYIVVAHVHSGGSLITMTIPKALLTTSDQNFCISDETDYIVFRMKYSGTTATLTIGNKSSDGWVSNVYGVY